MPEREASVARLLERLLADADFRAAYRRDPGAAARAAGFDDLAPELEVPGRRALETLEVRESREGLAGVMMAAAVEGVAAMAFYEHVLPGLGDILPGVDEAQAAVPRHDHGGLADQLGADGSGGAPTDETLALLRNPHVVFDAVGVSDLKAGRIDPRVVSVLGELSRKHELVVSAMASDHPKLTAGGSVSNHYVGRAVDIASVDGKPVNASNAAARRLAVALDGLDPSIRPDEIGSPWVLPGPAHFTDAAHQNHVHVGFDQPLPAQWQPASVPPPGDEDAAQNGAAVAGDAPDLGDAGDDDVASGDDALSPGGDAEDSGGDEDAGDDGEDSGDDDEDSGDDDGDSGDDDGDEDGDEDEDSDDAGGDEDEPDEDEPDEDEPDENEPDEDEPDENEPDVREPHEGNGEGLDPEPDPASTPSPGDLGDPEDAEPGDSPDAPDPDDQPDAPLGGGPLDYPGDTAKPAEIATWMGGQARRRGLPPELPVMAALVESDLTNVGHGDADSVGFFQMRASVWDSGPYAGYAGKPELQLKWFLDSAARVQRDRQNRGLPMDANHYGEWIADVERPAAQYRGRYQLRLDDARDLLRSGDGAGAVELVADQARLQPGHSALVALAAAEKQIGVRYTWGGSSPRTGFDCSGLVQWAYRQAGIELPRVTEDQIRAPGGRPVGRAELLPGDLVFFRNASGDVHHVGISLGRDKFVAAPHTGDVVHVSSLREPGYAKEFAGGRRFDAATPVRGREALARTLPAVSP